MTEARSPERPVVRVDDCRYSVVDVKRGGMGQVFILERAVAEAWDPVYRPRVAVKTFSHGTAKERLDLDAERVRNELNIWIGLAHPGIVPLRKIVRLNFELGALMPVYPGSLLDEIQRKGPHNAQQVVDIGLQLLSALDHAFTVNAVLHLDIKPANVLVEHSDTDALTCRVSDWGIATIQRELADSLRVPGHSLLQDRTHTYAAFGTLPYMAPERVVPGSRATAQCDIYSVGVLLSELLTGKVPCIGNVSDYIDRLISGHVAAAMMRDLNALPYASRLAQVIRGCVHPNPGDRYATHRQAAAALRSSLSTWDRLRRILGIR